MTFYPLCISCGVSLQVKINYDSLFNEIYHIYYCPSCQEIYQDLEENIVLSSKK